MKKSRIIALLMGAALSFSLVAGCGGTGSNNGGSGTPSDSASGDTIKVGALGPYTGDVAQYGIAVYEGFELYINQVNAAGGVNGKQLEIVKYDEKGDATEAVNAYYKLVEDGVAGIVGDVTSTPTIAVAQASVADNMPCVTASATAADVISYGSNTFRACVTDPYQGVIMANFAKEMNYSKVGVIYNSGDDYSTGCTDAFIEHCGELGIEVVSSQGYAAGDVDFNAQLTSIMSAGAETIFCPNYYQDNGKIVTQARQLGYEGGFLGADGWSGIVGGDENYADPADLYDCYFCCSFVADNAAENVQQFISDFTEAYGSTPTNFNALGYDAAMIMVAGITSAENDGLEVGTDEYKQAVIDGIAAGTVDGVTGSISYDGTGDPVKSAVIVTITDGQATFYENL